METYICKAVIRELGEIVRVQLYYVTVENGGDPREAFGEQDVTPDLVSLFVIDKLTDAEAATFSFKAGEVQNVSDV